MSKSPLDKTTTEKFKSIKEDVTDYTIISVVHFKSKIYNTKSRDLQIKPRNFLESEESNTNTKGKVRTSTSRIKFINKIIRTDVIKTNKTQRTNSRRKSKDKKKKKESTH